MKAETLNPAELRAAGYKALAAALGPLGMARFLLQFEHGHGDYTRQRREWAEHRVVLKIGGDDVHGLAAPRAPGVPQDPLDRQVERVRAVEREREVVGLRRVEELGEQFSAGANMAIGLA